MNKFWSAVRGRRRRARSVWLGVTWVLAVLQVSLGVLYVSGGFSAVLTTRPFALFAHLPGGLRLHGTIMLALGLTLVVTLCAPLMDRDEPLTFMRWVLLAVTGYFLWSDALFALAPFVHNGAFSYTSVIIWTCLAALPAILFSSPPPVRGIRNEIELANLAVGLGISPALAMTLAESYLHGADVPAE